MNTKFKTKDLVTTALLIAFGILIPLAFGFLRVTLPPAFTATLLAHVPIFIAMFISPLSALFTAIGTTIGFAFGGCDPVVVARAGSHIVFALVGAFMIKKRYSLVLTGIAVTVIHALVEALTVYAFLALGWSAIKEGQTFFMVAFYTTGIGTLIHSTIDYIIAVLVGSALARAHVIPPLPHMFKNKQQEENI